MDVGPTSRMPWERTKLSNCGSARIVSSSRSAVTTTMARTPAAAQSATAAVRLAGRTAMTARSGGAGSSRTLPWAGSPTTTSAFGLIGCRAPLKPLSSRLRTIL